MTTRDEDYESRLGHRQRLREKVQRDEDLTQLETLELLLTYAIPRKDVQPIARRLLAKFGDIKGVLDADLVELCEFEGLGENSATLLKLMPGLLKKYRSDAGKSIRLPTRKAAIDYLKPHLDNERNEQLHMLCLDGGYKLLRHECMAEGTEAGVKVYVKKLCALALRSGAVNVILSHNHPSGIAQPSLADDETTGEAYRGFRTLGIHLVDHIIISPAGEYSYFANGRFSEFERGGALAEEEVSDKHRWKD